MIRLLARLFIKERDNINDPETRRQYGMLCGGLGIFLNILLSAGKLLAGSISGSIAVTADALNNLTDASSSMITLIGFRLAGRRSDSEHPFGHGRMEYISGLIVAMLIVVVGVELLKSSIEKIIDPSPVEFTAVAAFILLASIGVKLYMLFYNRSIGKKINSAAMKATAMDSLSDCAATAVVLLSMVIGHFAEVNIDGYCGALVALFIIYTGCVTAKDIISPLLGQPPDAEFVQRIEELVMGHEDIIGMHDLIVHDYGPGQCMISLHAEVPADGDILVMHDTVDNIENELKAAMGCQAVIHMDPVRRDDPLTNELRQAIVEQLRGYNSQMTLHDFRMVPGPTHSNVIFDVVAPYDIKLSNAEIQELVGGLVRQVRDDLVPVVSIDRPYH